MRKRRASSVDDKQIKDVATNLPRALLTQTHAVLINSFDIHGPSPTKKKGSNKKPRLAHSSVLAILDAAVDDGLTTSLATPPVSSSISSPPSTPSVPSPLHHYVDSGLEAPHAGPSRIIIDLTAGDDESVSSSSTIYITDSD